jgi:hypothetical protein
MCAAIYRPGESLIAFSGVLGPSFRILALLAFLSLLQRTGEVKKAQAPFAMVAADDGLLSFFAATFAPIKFERSPERLAETFLR